MKKVVITSIFSIIILGLILLGAYLLATEDKEGPVIIFEDEILYTEGDSEDTLLLDVSATDKKDGDVSDTLMIESIVPLKDEPQIRVVYVAKDDSNNITKISRTIAYARSNETTENNQKEVIESETTETTDNTEEGSEVQDKPTIELTQSEVSVTKGTEINYMNYIQSIEDDKDEESKLWGRIIIDGEPEDSNEPGDYEITYQVIDSDRNKSEKKSLMLHITEQ